jgi:hypothetical protein
MCEQFGKTIGERLRYASRTLPICVLGRTYVVSLLYDRPQVFWTEPESASVGQKDFILLPAHGSINVGAGAGDFGARHL